MTKSLWKASLLLAALMLLALWTAACGGGGESEPGADAGGSAGSVERGEELFKSTIIGSKAAPGCMTCHSLEPDITIVGPSMAGIATRAAEEVPGQSAEEYIHESIVEPDAYVVEGFPAGVMYQKYAQDLSEQEISDLTAFLLTLR